MCARPSTPFAKQSDLCIATLLYNSCVLAAMGARSNISGVIFVCTTRQAVYSSDSTPECQLELLTYCKKQHLTRTVLGTGGSLTKHAQAICDVLSARKPTSEDAKIQAG